MAEGEPTYTFKEYWDMRFQSITSDIGEIKEAVKGLQSGQDSNGKEIAEIKGKMIVYGSLSIILGTAIASTVVKLIG